MQEEGNIGPGGAGAEEEHHSQASAEKIRPGNTVSGSAAIKAEPAAESNEEALGADSMADVQRDPAHPEDGELSDFELKLTWSGEDHAGMLQVFNFSGILGSTSKPCKCLHCTGDGSDNEAEAAPGKKRRVSEQQREAERGDLPQKGQKRLPEEQVCLSLALLSLQTQSASLKDNWHCAPTLSTNGLSASVSVHHAQGEVY